MGLKPEGNRRTTRADRRCGDGSFNKWIAGLAGFDGFPYNTVEVNVVGYAVRDRSLLEGDTSGLDIYTTTDEGGIPQCDPRCGRFFHQDGDYSQCPGGASRHYGIVLFPAVNYCG